MVEDRISAQRVAAVNTTRATVVRLQLNISRALSATTALTALVMQGSGQVALDGPFNLLQGGLGAVGRLPVFLPDAHGQPVFWGFTSVLIRFPAMLDTVGFADIEHQGYRWVLWRMHPDTGLRQVIASSDGDTLDAPASLAMPVPNGEWTFSVAPVAGWGDAVYQRNAMALGLFISLFVALVYFLARCYPTLLRAEVAQRTRSESEEALRIAATAFEAQQGMFITNAQHVILRVNQAFTDMTGYGAEEAVGQNPRIMKSGRHDSAFYAAMAQGLENKGAWAGEIWNRRKNGEIYPEWLSISTVKNDADQTTHYVSIFSDISERVNAQTQIDTLAFYHPLTRLPNRRLLLDRLEQALHASTHHARKNALLFVDLDNFKTVNDTAGHHQGDKLLTQVALRLSTCIREGDTVSHFGSDEFVVMLEDLNGDTQDAASQAETVGKKILAALAQDYALAGGAHHSTASIGVTLFGSEQQESNEEPLKRAELAMFQAKAAGRNTLRFFDAQMQVNVSARAALEADLREAVQRQQFLLHYQPQIGGAGRITGVEALVRWQRGRSNPR